MKVCKIVLNNIWITPNADKAADFMSMHRDFQSMVDKLAQQNLESETNLEGRNFTYEQLGEIINEDLVENYYDFWNDYLKVFIISRMMQYSKSNEFAQKLAEYPKLDVTSWELSDNELNMEFADYSHKREHLTLAIKEACENYFDDHIDQWLDEAISNYGEIRSRLVSVQYQTKILKEPIKNVIGFDYDMYIDIQYAK